MGKEQDLGKQQDLGKLPVGKQQGVEENLKTDDMTEIDSVVGASGSPVQLVPRPEGQNKAWRKSEALLGPPKSLGLSLGELLDRGALPGRLY